MADNTDRFGLNTYSDGDTDWTHNDVVQQVDELAIERGVIADRPASGDYDGELYFAEDDLTLFKWDANSTSWGAVAGLGTDGSPLPQLSVEQDSLKVGGTTVENLFADAGHDHSGETINPDVTNADEFTLPSGWSLTENNGGEVVIENPGGSEILRWDESVGEWVTDSINLDSLDANTLVGADIENSSGNQILVAQGDGTLSLETQAQGPNPYDQAQSFVESGLSVPRDKTVIQNGSIALRPEQFSGGSTEYFATSTISNSTGIAINPNEPIDELRITLADQLDPVSTVFVTDTDINILAEDTTGHQPGDQVRLSGLGLQSGTEYNVGVWNDGNSYTYPDDSPNDDGRGAVTFVIGRGRTYPDDSAGPFDSAELLSIKAIEKVIPPASSGSAEIEWSPIIPTDIYKWDSATFTRTVDNETVNVFVAYSSDGGSTWTRTNSGNPISRSYSLEDDGNITPGVGVRIEAELSRTDTSNNPTLDSAYRSWFV